MSALKQSCSPSVPCFCHMVESVTRMVVFTLEQSQAETEWTQLSELCLNIVPLFLIKYIPNFSTKDLDLNSSESNPEYKVRYFLRAF